MSITLVTTLHISADAYEQTCAPGETSRRCAQSRVRHLTMLLDVARFSMAVCSFQVQAFSVLELNRPGLPTWHTKLLRLAQIYQHLIRHANYSESVTDCAYVAASRASHMCFWKPIHEGLELRCAFCQTEPHNWTHQRREHMRQLPAYGDWTFSENQKHWSMVWAGEHYPSTYNQLLTEAGHRTQTPHPAVQV